MILIGTFLAFLGLVALASLVGQHLRRQCRRQYPPPYVVRDEPLDITPAIKRSRP